MYDILNKVLFGALALAIICNCALGVALSEIQTTITLGKDNPLQVAAYQLKNVPTLRLEK